MHVASQGLNRRPAATTEDVEDGVKAEEIFCAAPQTRRVRCPLEMLETEVFRDLSVMKQGNCFLLCFY